MTESTVYVNGKFFGHFRSKVLPSPGDRIVFLNDAYTGYIVKYREFIGDKEIKLMCKLDK